MIRKYWKPCAGSSTALYSDMAAQNHLLIAGATGSGKSVVVNGIISNRLHLSPSRVEFIFIDPKRVELSAYKDVPHCLRYASEPAQMIDALRYAMDITEDRFKDMAARGLKKWDGGDVYVVIDELADLMTTCRKDVQPLLQRLCQLGRAAHVHVIAATQCPLAKIIPTEIKVNFDSRVALRTATAQHSRNIMDCKGCETLPQHGKGFYVKPSGTVLYNIPLVTDDEIERIVAHWKRYNKPRSEAWYKYMDKTA